MKRNFYICFLLVAVLLQVFASCQEVHNDKSVSSEVESIAVITTEPLNEFNMETVTATETMELQPLFPKFYDFDEFLQYLNELKQNADSNSSSVNATLQNESIPIPKLLSDDYKFLFVRDNPTSFFYYYVPVDFDEPFFNMRKGFIVTVSKSNCTYYTWYDQIYKKGIVIDGFLCEARNGYDEITLNDDGRGISISFPSEINILDDPNRLYEYFSFEDFYLGNNSNTVVE